MAEPRKHHYLPQFYLRRFSSNGKSIYQIEKGMSRAYLCAIGDTAAIRDYHRLDYAGVKDQNAVEKSLAEIESNHSDALQRVIEGEIDVPGVHTRLIEFVSFMSVRVPVFKSHVEESLRQLVRSLGVTMERNGNFPPVPDGLEEYLRMDRVSIEIANWKCLEVMFDMATEPTILATLATMTPSLLLAPNGRHFLTSDQPVVLYNHKASPHDAYGYGLLDKDTEVTFALSSQVVLHLSWGSNFSKNQVLSSSQVDEFNRRAIIMADALIFAPQKTETVTDLIARHEGYSAGVKREILDTGSGHLLLSRNCPVMPGQQYFSSAKQS